LGTRGGILGKVDLPSDGEYIVDVADLATHIWGNGMEFENPLVVTLDNRIVYQTIIGGEEDMKLYDQVQNGALDRVNARLKNIRFTAVAGPHRIGVAFKRRTFTDVELASKLSFFLWNTIPDEELLQLGVDGKLSEPAVLERQVRRMLADPRSVTLAGNFVPQWLDMKRLDEIVPDSAVFPYASG